jgi:hypothetical protein
MKIFVTRREFARLKNLDPRNRRIQELQPDGLLRSGSKLLPIFQSVDPERIAPLTPLGPPKILV